jgi:hypothetical protein
MTTLSDVSTSPSRVNESKRTLNVIWLNTFLVDV